MIFPRSLVLLEGREQGVVFNAYRISTNNVCGNYCFSKFKLIKKAIFYFINWIIAVENDSKERVRGQKIFTAGSTVYILKILAPSIASIKPELRWAIWVNLIFKYPYMESNVKLGCFSIISWCSMIFYDLFLSRFSL